MDNVCRKFDFEGQHYEIRVRVTEDQRIFAAFRENKPVNRITYWKSIHETQIPDEMLIDLAEMDVKDHVWESNVAAWREIQLAKDTSKE
jgi:hypothetical protein